MTESRKLSAFAWSPTLLALAATVLFVLVYMHCPKFAVHHFIPYLAFRIQVQEWKTDVLRVGGLLLALCWYLVLARALGAKRTWPEWTEPVALTATCAFLLAFIEVFGRWQFGAYDYQIVLETGWRQYIGQRPYVDYLSSAPPGFDLGLRFAFQILHPGWNAVLLLTGLFAVATFLWSYWLLVRVGCSRPVAWLTALAIQSSTNLLLSFWWYNNTAMVAAVLFLLSCGLFLQRSVDWPARASFIFAFALLLTMKPNFAGLAIAGGLVTLLITSRSRWSVLSLSAAGSLLATLTLVACRISPFAMVAAYRGASKERGVFSRFGLDAFQPREFWDAYVSLWVILVPLTFLFLWAVFHWRQKPRLWLATLFLTATAIVIAIYGWRTNGEEADLEWTAILMAIGWFVAGDRSLPRPARWCSAALLVGMIFGDLFHGAERVRIYFVGEHHYYETDQNRNRIASGLLGGMYVGSSLIQEQIDAAEAMKRWDGPYFFGPRVDFSYAEYGLQSPLHFPAWFHPGTAFARAQLPQVLDIWQRDHFHTLLFARDDYTYYPPEFLQMIQDRYVLVRETDTLSVWRAKPDWLARPDFRSPDGSGLPVAR